MTRKEMQTKMNTQCECVWNASKQVYHSTIYGRNWKRLRSMSAEVLETEQFYFLRSYNTVIAIIDRSTDTCYDMLRLVYGYTATSAKHVSAFDHDYGSDKWGCKNRFTWRQV